MKAVNQRIRRYEFKQRIDEHFGDDNKMVDESIGNADRLDNDNLLGITAKEKIVIFKHEHTTR